jgi:hypothetical protein
MPGKPQRATRRYMGAQDSRLLAQETAMDPGMAVAGSLPICDKDAQPHRLENRAAPRRGLLRDAVYGVSGSFRTA